MKQPHIGVLGATGQVGRATLAFLQSLGSVSLRAGSRKPDAAGRQNGIEYVAVDIMDTAALQRFCNGCAVVVNCAGPSYLVADRVARAAFKAGAQLVDAFGGPRLMRLLQAWPERPAGLAFVVSAGVFPGLSEILPGWLAHTAHFERIEQIVAHGGGSEACSRAGGADVLLSTLDGFGHGEGAGYTAPPGFSFSAFAQPFVSEDFLSMARRLACREAQWFSVFPSEAVPQMIHRCCSELSSLDAVSRRKALDSVVERLIAVAERELMARAPYYVMTAKLKGMIKGEPACKQVVLRCDDSYRLSGQIAAIAALEVLNSHVKPGIHTAWQVLDPEKVIQMLQDRHAFNAFYVVDLPVEYEADVDAFQEEGVL